MKTSCVIFVGIVFSIFASATTAETFTSLLGDKDGFGFGLTEGSSRYGFFDNRGPEDPPFTDVEPVPTTAEHAFSYTHNLGVRLLPPIQSATLRLFTFGIQDGDNQVYGSDQNERLFLDGCEVPGAFDDVDQFDYDYLKSQWVEIAGTVEFQVPQSCLENLLDGKVDVKIAIEQYGTAGYDGFAIDYSELTVEGTPAVFTPVTIDIKPGSFPNSINVQNNGQVAVAILTTDAAKDNTITFDATTVDPAFLSFGATGTEATPVQYDLEDVDRDGDTDMIVHFNTTDTGIKCGDTSETLMGITFDQQAIQGTDSVNTPGC